MKILYFTATGNCLYVAKQFGGDMISIPQAIKEERYEFSDDKIGLVIPIYWLGIPLYVEDFLKKVKLNSNYIFSFFTYGKFAGSASVQLDVLAKECGINFSYIKPLKMVDNFLPSFDMTKQIKNEPEKMIDEHLQSIINDVNSSRILPAKSSIIAKLISKKMRKRSMIGDGMAMDFLVEDACVKCGECGVLCPLDNVKAEGFKPEFGARCMSCLACTQNCPTNSIRIRKEKSNARFRNQHITLKEIEDANR